MDLSKVIQEELNQLRVDIINAHISAGQKASGKTSESLSVENITSDSGEIWGTKYIGVLETGRKGGKVPYDFKNILKRWALAKGLSFSSESDFNRWAYFVSQKIKREGTKLYLAGGRKDILSQPINNFSERFTKKITSQFEMELTNKIFAK